MSLSVIQRTAALLVYLYRLAFILEFWHSGYRVVTMRRPETQQEFPKDPDMWTERNRSLHVGFRHWVVSCLCRSGGMMFSVRATLSNQGCVTLAEGGRFSAKASLPSMHSFLTDGPLKQLGAAPPHHHGLDGPMKYVE